MQTESGKKKFLLWFLRECVVSIYDDSWNGNDKMGIVSYIGWCNGWNGKISVTVG